MSDERSKKAPGDADDAGTGSVTFGEFVLSLAANAMIHMGGDPDEEGRLSGKVNLPVASQHIDILAMLRAKTQGNLEKSESDLLDSLLYDLRMRYLEVAQTPAPGA